MLIFKIVSTIIVWALGKKNEPTALIAEITLMIIDAIIEWMKKKGYFKIFDEKPQNKEPSNNEEAQSESTNSSKTEDVTDHSGNSS